MDIERFEGLVDQFGEFPADWPLDVRASAIYLLETSREAQEIVAEAAKMRALFARSKPVNAPAGLADKIVMLARDGGPPASGQTPWFSQLQSSLLPKDSLSPRKRLVNIVSKLSLRSAVLRVKNSLKSGRPNYVILWCCFTVGLGLGLGFGFSPSMATDRIDFVTMFAVVGS
jgi:hypothetical protein